MSEYRILHIVTIAVTIPRIKLCVCVCVCGVCV
jgi:hypothetical protein